MASWMPLRDGLLKKGWRTTEMKKESISFSILILAAITIMVTTTTAISISQIVTVASAFPQQQTAAQRNSLEESNKILVRSAIQEIFNDHNISAVDKYIKEDLIQNNTGFPEGREARKQYFGVLFDAFPDLHSSIDKMIAEDDLVSVFLSWNGTHKGEFQGMPATNNSITMKTAHTFRIEDGMVAEQWEVFDILDLLSRTGAIAFNGEE
jgi:predicted SnoaL-like aldol condensation-catalyzing enzyme